MARAIVDPAELRRFASHLKQFNGDLRDRMGSLHSQLNGLGDTWRDQEHDKFVREFEQTLKTFCPHTSKTIMQMEHRSELLMGGMIAVVILALLLVPVFFVWIQRLFSRAAREESRKVPAGEVYGPPAPAQTVAAE